MPSGSIVHGMDLIFHNQGTHHCQQGTTGGDDKPVGRRQVDVSAINLMPGM